MDLFSKTEIIIMISILGAILLIIAVLTVMDFFDERKKHKGNSNKSNKKSKKEKEIVVDSKIKEADDVEILDFSIDFSKPKEDLIESSIIVNSDDSLIIDEDVEVKYEEITPLVITNDTVVVEESHSKNLDKVLEIIKEELKTDVEDYENTITNFELEQEENAIISYDELIKVSDKLYDQNEYRQYDDGNEPITIDEVIKRFGDEEMTFENTANYDKLHKNTDNGDKRLIELFKQE